MLKIILLSLAWNTALLVINSWNLLNIFNKLTPSSKPFNAVLNNPPPFPDLLFISELNLKNNLSSSLGKDDKISLTSFLTFKNLAGFICEKILKKPCKEFIGVAILVIFALVQVI